MGLPAGLSTCPHGQDDSGVAAEERFGLYEGQGLALGKPDLNPLDNKLWAVLEDMAWRKCHNNLESLKRTLVKAAAEISLETVRTAIAEWPQCLKACVGAEGGHLSDIIINKNLKLLLINYLARKVDVLFHFPSRSQNPCNRTYGKTMYHATQKRNSTYLYTVTYLAMYRVSQEEWTNFRRVFLMLKYTDITQNTYVQS